MRRFGSRLLLIVFFCTLIISALMIPASANSAEPPSVVIIVNNPPRDLSLTLMADEGAVQPNTGRAAWEGYFSFYRVSLQAGQAYSLQVSTGGETFTCALEQPLEHYNNLYTLNLSDKTLTPGTYPWRTALLVCLRVLLTLLIEGGIFRLFGYRKRRSWVIFLIINLITQGLLNVWLSSQFTMVSSYIVFGLVIGEFFVFIAEMIAFPLLLNENKKSRGVLYAFIANLVSLIAGGFILTFLPI